MLRDVATACAPTREVGPAAYRPAAPHAYLRACNIQMPSASPPKDPQAGRIPQGSTLHRHARSPTSDRIVESLRGQTAGLLRARENRIPARAVRVFFDGLDVTKESVRRASGPLKRGISAWYDVPAPAKRSASAGLPFATTTRCRAALVLLPRTARRRFTRRKCASSHQWALLRAALRRYGARFAGARFGLAVVLSRHLNKRIDASSRPRSRCTGITSVIMARNRDEALMKLERSGRRVMRRCAARLSCTARTTSIPLADAQKQFDACGRRTDRPLYRREGGAQPCHRTIRRCSWRDGNCRRQRLRNIEGTTAQKTFHLADHSSEGATDAHDWTFRSRWMRPSCCARTVPAGAEGRYPALELRSLLQGLSFQQGTRRVESHGQGNPTRWPGDQPSNWSRRSRKCVPDCYARARHSRRRPLAGYRPHMRASTAFSTTARVDPASRGSGKVGLPGISYYPATSGGRRAAPRTWPRSACGRVGRFTATRCSRRHRLHLPQDWRNADNRGTGRGERGPKSPITGGSLRPGPRCPRFARAQSRRHVARVLAHR